MTPPPASPADRQRDLLRLAEILSATAGARHPSPEAASRGEAREQAA